MKVNWPFTGSRNMSPTAVVNLLGDPVHVCDLFLVADDLDGGPHVLDHLGIGLPLLLHAGHDFLIHLNCRKQSKKITSAAGSTERTETRNIRDLRAITRIGIIFCSKGLLNF